MSKVLKNNKGRLFRPTFVRGKPSNSLLKESSGNPLVFDNIFVDTNLSSTSSFRYGDKKNIVSTQQVRIDWSKFENHTFFHSAVANVNEAFDRIINFYPLGGTKKEIEQFEDNLTGFEKYVLDNFPKNIGYINFIGTAVGEPITNGTYIEVKDSAGSEIKSISKNKSGETSLNPNESPFSFEFFVNIPEQPNDCQIIAQKFKTIAKHITLAISESSSNNDCLLYFGIHSGSSSNIVTGSVPKGEFVHISAQYDKKRQGKLNLLINNNLIESTNNVNFGSLNFDVASLFLGKGETARMGRELFEQKQSFSGSIDDFKFFHQVNDTNEIIKNRHKSSYPRVNDDNLRLYYKFNEPYGEYVGNNIVLDSSKFSFHSTITNFSINNRLTGSDVPVASEDKYRSPVLFPTYKEVDDFNYQLLTTASLYDDYNPNLITKLIPQHYFQEATNFKDFQDELEALEARFSSFSNSEVAKKVSDIPSVQILIKLLLVYAKHFDEIKILIDAVTSFNYTYYDENETTPDPLLLEKAKVTNTVLPKILGFGNIEQVFEGIDLTDKKAKSAKSLSEIQNLVWRRILSESPKNKKRKGTIDSIKSIFRSAGIEPDNILDFREYGGSKIKSLKGSTETKKDVIRFLDFNFSKNNTASTYDYQGYPSDGEVPHLKSGYLFKPRTQYGNPPMDGLINSVTGENTIPADGLLTSGSFTYEGLYKWPKNYKTSEKESLIRLHITSSQSPGKESVVSNLVANEDGITLYTQERNGYDVLTLFLSGANVFDGDIWNVSFGKKDVHDFESAVSSSYFVRAGKQKNGEISEIYFTSSFFNNPPGTNVNTTSFLKLKNAYSTSGSFLVIGSQSFPTSTQLLNSLPGDPSRTDFFGSVANIRFYSKNTTIEEWKSRVKNYTSVGVENPELNYNFNTIQEGSFERLVLQTDAKQSTTGSNSNGEIRLFDFTQNNFHFEGFNFPPNTNLMTNVRTQYEIMSDKFDINYAKNKIRIKSYQDTNNLDNSSDEAAFAPVSEVISSNESVDDNRLSLDMSVMKGLNRNILTIFSDLESFSDYLGNPNILFSDSYPSLKFVRELYFNNLTEKIDLQKFREIFRWIDGSFTEAVYSVVPRNTNFLGINFIYESHVLERNRFKYLYDKIYLDSENRDEFIFDNDGIESLGGSEQYSVPPSPVPPPTTETPIVPAPEVIRKREFDGSVGNY